MQRFRDLRDVSRRWESPERLTSRKASVKKSPRSSFVGCPQLARVVLGIEGTTYFPNGLTQLHQSFEGGSCDLAVKGRVMFQHGNERRQSASSHILLKVSAGALLYSERQTYLFPVPAETLEAEYGSPAVLYGRTCLYLVYEFSDCVRGCLWCAEVTSELVVGAGQP